MAATDKNRMKKMMTMAAAATLATAVVVGGGSFAYLKDVSTKDNPIATNQVTAEISETEESYSIIPGTFQTKDPTLKVTYTLDSFVFVKITDKTRKTDGKRLVKYSVANGWTKLGETTVNEDGYYETVYYRLVKYTNVNGVKQTDEFKILKGNKISYDKSLVNADMLDSEGNLRTDVALNFEGKIIQARPFTDKPVDGETPTTAEAALKAWNETDVQTDVDEIHVTAGFNDTDGGFRALIKSVAAGETKTIVLDDDMYIEATTENKQSYNYRTYVSGNVTLDLNGHNIYSDEAVVNGVNLFTIKSGGSLTVEGDGKIEMLNNINGSPVFEIENGGKLTIEDGTFNVYGKIVYAEAGSEVEIYGGTFSSYTPYGNWYLLNAANEDDVNVYGGTFINFDPSTGKEYNKGTVGNSTGKNLVADGYEAVRVDYDDIPWFIVQEKID